MVTVVSYQRTEDVTGRVSELSLVTTSEGVIVIFLLDTGVTVAGLIEEHPFIPSVDTEACFYAWPTPHADYDYWLPKYERGFGEDDGEGDQSWVLLLSEAPCRLACCRGMPPGVLRTSRHL